MINYDRAGFEDHTKVRNLLYQILTILFWWQVVSVLHLFLELWVNFQDHLVQNLLSGRLEAQWWLFFFSYYISEKVSEKFHGVIIINQCKYVWVNLIWLLTPCDWFNLPSQTFCNMLLHSGTLFRTLLHFATFSTLFATFEHFASIMQRVDTFFNICNMLWRACSTDRVGRHVHDEWF